MKTIRSIWTVAFDVDSGLIFGQKIKSHTGNPFNDYVDGLADLGSAGSPCPGKRTQSTASLLSDLDAFKRNNNANFMALPAADSFFHTDGLATPQQTIDSVYGRMVSAGVALLSIVQSFVTDAAPTRPYINTKCL